MTDWVTHYNLAKMNKLNEIFGLKKVFGQLGIEERSFNLLIMIERMENKILNHS